MELLGYVRVSTIKQLEGGGAKIQEEAIKNYCASQNHKLKKLYADKGVSAYKNRPEFNKLMNDLDKGDGVIVYDLTRFGRSTQDLLAKIQLLEDRNKKFISTKENIDLSTKTGRLLFTLLSAIAEFEAATIRERMEAGREYAMRHGTRSGKPCHRPEKNIDWKKVDAWLERGLSLNAISKILEPRVCAATLYNRYKMRDNLP